MATFKYPHRNVNMPMDPDALAAARSRFDPGTTGLQPMPSGPADGKGSRREVRKGEWIDDRVINIGGPSSPSKDSPPELPERRDVPPATYDPLKAYAVVLGKPATFAGRVLSPAKSYTMTGDTCTEITTNHPGAIIDVVEMGDIPVHPDATPSAAKAPEGKAKKA
jgi:hypothetical protein